MLESVPRALRPELDNTTPPPSHVTKTNKMHARYASRAPELSDAEPRPSEVSVAAAPVSCAASCDVVCFGTFGRSFIFYFFLKEHCAHAQRALLRNHGTNRASPNHGGRGGGGQHIIALTRLLEDTGHGAAEELHAFHNRTIRAYPCRSFAERCGGKGWTSITPLPRELLTPSISSGCFPPRMTSKPSM